VSGAAAALARGREAVATGAHWVCEALLPLITLGRGLARLVVLAGRWWARTPKERRSPALFLAAAGGVVVAVLPHGPGVAVIALIIAALRLGRRPARKGGAAVGREESARLKSLYEALVPTFAVPGDGASEPLYAHDGEWRRAFEEAGFGPDGRVSRLVLRYPAHFADGDPERRLAVERLLCAKAGREREYRFVWEEEHNRLELSVPPPLPSGVHAQRFVAGQGEVVLGFTDADAVCRTVPVTTGSPDGGPCGEDSKGGKSGRDGRGFEDYQGCRGEEFGRARTLDLPPVVWRTGPRAGQPHLLALGAPGSGTSTLLRCVALQALRCGDVLLLDGGGSGEFAPFAGRAGVLAVESSPAGALGAVEWAAAETERRLLAASGARQAGRAVPEDARRPLWILLDRPAGLSHLARAEGRADPQELLEVPLRHGRAAGVTVAVAEHFEGAGALGRAVRAYTRARVVLGAASAEETRAALGEAAPPLPEADASPGRGFARMGAGRVLRLRVPSTPDPYDESAGEAERRAVAGLLPPPAGRAGEEATGLAAPSPAKAAVRAQAPALAPAAAAAPAPTRAAAAQTM
jgi:hypothetical protein